MISHKNGRNNFALGRQLIPLAVVALLALVPLGAAAETAPVPLTTALSDNFTQDTSLNANLWAINGPVALNFSGNNCPGCSVISLSPSFSSAGMEIANANASSVIGAIQSVQNFTAPITVTALVKGLVSDGHPFVFGISSQNASSGVQLTGNLNPNDCSAEANCGNPTTCGTPANSTIPPDQCFYGIYARAGTSGGNWKKTPALELTPAVQVVYALTIAVDSSGAAQFNVSAGGQVLGQATSQVGTGPFYIIMAQSEGAPVPGPGPNSAVWMSVTLSPSATLSPPASSSPSGVSSMEWLLLVLVVIVVAILLVILVASRRRRRELTVTVLDTDTLSPIPRANVSANGPSTLSGTTGTDGTVAFGGVKAGPYEVHAGATGYSSPPPMKIPVERTTTHTIRLSSVSRSVPGGAVAATPAVGRSQPPLEPTRGPVPPPPPTPAAMAGPPGPSPPAAGPTAPVEEEEFGGDRIRAIIQSFRAKGAVSPETALTAQELGLSRIFVRIMKRRRGKTHVFVEVGGKYYLDENALRAMK